MDLFFCNNTVLHLAFANMDTFLRLKDPGRHGGVSTTCSTILWLGASWIIAAVQSMAQFMLSQEDTRVVQNGVCFIPDKNFVLLGILFAFLIPTVVAILFHVLCVIELKNLRTGKFLEDIDHPRNYGSNESVCDDDEVVVRREEVCLSGLAGDEPGSPGSQCEDTSFVENARGELGGFPDPHDPLSTSCTLLLRDCEQPRINAEEEHASPDELLRRETQLSRLMALLLIGSVLLWLPLCMGSIVYGLCESCRLNINPLHMRLFRWLAYGSGALGPVIYPRFSPPLRQTYCKFFTCGRMAT